MKNIIFTSRQEISKEYHPKPAGSMLPELYVKTPSYGGYKGIAENIKTILHNGEPNSTIKKCMPVQDALSAGYILVTHADVAVKMEERETEPIIVSRGGMSFGSHDNKQAKHHPSAKSGMSIPKIHNPWLIKTPPGYSTLFTSPMHSPNGFFTCFDGIVDTDSYTQEVNFPFTLDDPNFEGIIPAGTPIVQVIPFKRDEWEMVIGGRKEIEESAEAGRKLFSKMYNAYRSVFWHRKTFR
jgi:hypothetical protein